jgi:flagellin-like protein
MVGGEPVVTGRKGMSPLIATVLLMAFAVALGGIIININITPFNDCDKVQVAADKFCLQDGQIHLQLKNSENVRLLGVVLSYEQDGIEAKNRIVNSKLERGQQSPEWAVKANVAQGTKVQLFGQIGDEKDPVDCNAKPIAEANPIQNC